jgi:hydroxymethylglutaryl-CoA lyase
MSARTIVGVMPEAVTIREVGPRDGLQAEAPIEPVSRIRLIEALLAAGVTNIELAAFVSPRAVPAMAGAEDVVNAVGPRPGLVRAALVPNAVGARRALDCGVDELTVTISASAAYSQKNVRMTPQESLREVDAICSLATEGAVPVDAVVSCAFGSPYEGDISPSVVGDMATALAEAGTTRVTLADTTGMATPRRLEDVLAVTGPVVGLHLHETRGTGLLNLYAGLVAGVRRFDCSVGGLGGSPFAAGAAGNVATEEAVALLDDLGIATGIDAERLIDAALLAEDLLGHPVPSRVAHAGPRTRRSPADTHS